jgi:hypothetical protein
MRLINQNDLGRVSHSEGTLLTTAGCLSQWKGPLKDYCV